MNMKRKAWSNALIYSTLFATNFFSAAYADSPSIAQVYKLRPSYTACLDKANTDTGPSRECMTTELDYQNNRLNKAYKDLMSKLNAGNKSKLQDDERTWIKYRDSRCANVIYGIEQPELSGLECSVEETAKRASDIEAWLFQQ
jgi:uncharacterized protein YecT (DUF1311 family)